MQVGVQINFNRRYPTRTVRQVYTKRRGLRLPAPEDRPEDRRDRLVFTVAEK